MAMWHVMMGMGIGLLATILTVIVNQRRAISHQPKSNYFSPPGDICSICLSNMANDEMVYLNCGHAIHEKCFKDLKRYGDKKCPTCRQQI